jgi:serine/threonine-protein kinase
MEYLHGGSLEARVRGRGGCPAAQVLDWMEQAADALDDAHARGVVHRDIKPANLLLHCREQIRVADFGSASAVGLDSFTETGTVLGTAGYLSPEQARGERASPASDRYSLAVVAFELLAGERPFAANSTTAEAARHIIEPVPSIHRLKPGLPQALDRVFQRALSKTPGTRYSSAAELVAELRDAVQNDAGDTGRIIPGLQTMQTTPTLATRPSTLAARARISRRLPSSRLWAALLLLLLLGAGIAAAFAASCGSSSHRAASNTR